MSKTPKHQSLTHKNPTFAYRFIKSFFIFDLESTKFDKPQFYIVRNKWSENCRAI